MRTQLSHVRILSVARRFYVCVRQSVHIFVCICVQSLLLLVCRQGMCHRFSPFCIVGCVLFFVGGHGEPAENGR